MLGAMMGAAGGGGMSASSSASNEQKSSNDISSGTITVGGLNLNPKQSGFNAETVLLGTVVVGVGLAAVYGLKKIR